MSAIQNVDVPSAADVKRLWQDLQEAEAAYQFTSEYAAYNQALHEWSVAKKQRELAVKLGLIEEEA